MISVGIFNSIYSDRRSRSNRVFLARTDKIVNTIVSKMIFDTRSRGNKNEPENIGEPISFGRFVRT